MDGTATPANVGSMEGPTLPKPPHWLAMSELDQVTTRLPQDCVVPNASAVIYRTFYESAALTSEIGEGRHLIPCFALKAKVIQGFLHFTSIGNQRKLGVSTFRRLGAKPDSASTFEPPVANNGQPTDLGEELD